MRYSRITLATSAASTPGPLPAALVGLGNASLADLTAAINPVPAEYDGIGYWPVDIASIEYDPAVKAPTGTYTLEVDTETKRVTATPVLADRPLADIKAAKIAAIEAERDTRSTADFEVDFADYGNPLAIDDYGNSETAGVRSLQMRPVDQSNWGSLSSAALAAIVSGAPTTIVPMRVENNMNVQTTAANALAILQSVFQRNAGYLFFAGSLKTQTRDAEDAAAVAAIDIEAGWP